MKKLPSLNLLKQSFEYDPNTGTLLRILKSGKKKLAGRLHHSGYIELIFKANSYMAHRVAWFLHYGEDPGELQVDHKNRIRHDNRISNLRLATQSDNSCNCKTSSLNTSGVKGVDAFFGKWRARIRKNNKRILVGYFNSIVEAKVALAKERKKLHKQFTCHS